ncbi:MAG: YidC/Oxa1 family membrane protein insertase [Clostridia bacterium]
MFDFIAIPFGWVLKLIYELIGSYGLSLIVFTVFTKLILLPLMLKSKRSIKQVQKLQPRIQEIQKKYANNKQKQQEEIAKIYQDEQVNPAGSCLPTLITMPIMIGLYYVIQQPLTYIMRIEEEKIMQIASILNIEVTSLRLSEINIASQVFNNFDKVAGISENLMKIDFDFLGFNLAMTPSLTSGPKLLILIPVLSGIISYFSMQVTQKMQGTKDVEQPPAMKSMMITMPFMSAYFGFILPAGIGVYLITGNILSMIQEVFLTKYVNKLEEQEEALKKETAERAERNRLKEIELKKEDQKRKEEEKKNKKKK